MLLGWGGDWVDFVACSPEPRKPCSSHMQSSLSFPNHIQTPPHNTLESLKSCSIGAIVKAARLTKSKKLEWENAGRKSGQFLHFGEALIYLIWDVESYWSKLGLLLSFSSNTKGKQGVVFTLFFKSLRSYSIIKGHGWTDRKQIPHCEFSGWLLQGSWRCQSPVFWSNASSYPPEVWCWWLLLLQSMRC